jgi:hypothetical protein
VEGFGEGGGGAAECGAEGEALHDGEEEGRGGGRRAGPGAAVGVCKKGEGWNTRRGSGGGTSAPTAPAHQRTSSTSNTSSTSAARATSTSTSGPPSREYHDTHTTAHFGGVDEQFLRDQQEGLPSPNGGGRRGAARRRTAGAGAVVQMQRGEGAAMVTQPTNKLRVCVFSVVLAVLVVLVLVLVMQVQPLSARPRSRQGRRPRCRRGSGGRCCSRIESLDLTADTR